MKSIHISDVRAFRQCRRKWNWSSPLRRHLEPIKPYMPFLTGRAIHLALEKYYEDGSDMKETVLDYFAKERKNIEQNEEIWLLAQDDFDDQVELVWRMLDHYLMWIAQDDKKYSDGNLEFLESEVKFETWLPTLKGYKSRKFSLGGRFDGIVRHKETGDYWLFETKTTRSISELLKSLINDEQCGVYMHAAQKGLGIPVVGVLYNILRKKPATYPKSLKSGGVSKAVSVDTTAFAYKRAIIDHYPRWDEDTILSEYGAVLETLEEKEQKFFLRYPVYRSPEELRLLMQNIYRTASEMVSGRTPLYPSPSWMTCNFCSFKSPCYTMNQGYDPEVFLQEEYQLRRYDEETEETSNDTS